MKRIGILSDTHGFWDDKYAKYLGGCDEIWHAGDFGSTELADRLASLGALLRGVYGNCDGYDLRLRFPEVLRFRCEGVEVLMKHIGGYPGRYDPSIRNRIYTNPPQLFVSGHSHILKVMNDRNLHLLHINPGAAGMQGIHKVRTLVRLTVDQSDIRDLEVIELAEKTDGYLTC